MSELGELISPAVAHTEPNEDCPFCPPPENKTYKTFPGESNNSKKLGKIMETPSKLTDEQSNARPQTEKADADGYVQEQSSPDPRPCDPTKWYTFQAHHLISGKQALKGSVMEKWITASERNEKDTGYSVNSTGNGYWSPSTPKDLVGKWGPDQGYLTDKQRQEYAEKVMRVASAQIHIAPHNIKDPKDPAGHIHPSYDKYIRKKLASISKRITV